MNRYVIGNLLKKNRKMTTLTQEELAEVLNISVKTVQRIEKGDSGVGEETLFELAEYLDVGIAKKGFTVLYEEHTLNLLLKEYDIKILEKDNFDENELEALIRFFEIVEEKNKLTIKEELKKELKLKKSFKELEDVGIKIYVSLYNDAEILFDYEFSSLYIQENSPVLELYILKKTSPNIKKLKNKKTYIEVLDRNYIILKKSIENRKELDLAFRYLSIDDYKEILKRIEIDEMLNL